MIDQSEPPGLGPRLNHFLLVVGALSGAIGLVSNTVEALDGAILPAFCVATIFLVAWWLLRPTSSFIEGHKTKMFTDPQRRYIGLLGREDDIAQLQRQCDQYDTVVLTGPSGAGKTSLLRDPIRGFLVAESTRRRLFPVYVDLRELTGPSIADNDLIQLLQAALVTSIALSHDIGEGMLETLKAEIGEPPDLDGDSKDRATLFEYLGRLAYCVEKNWSARLLLIFDQFETYYVTTREDGQRGGAQQTTQELTDSRPFWRDMSVLIASSAPVGLMLVLASNEGIANVPQTFGFGRVRTFELEGLNGRAVKDYLDSLTTPERAVIRYPAAGWTDLRELLYEDLLGRRRHILGEVFSATLVGLTRLGHLTSAEYLARGGLSGLERAAFDEAFERGKAVFALTRAQFQCVLRVFVHIKDDTMVSAALTAEEIHAKSSKRVPWSVNQCVSWLLHLSKGEGSILRGIDAADSKKFMLRHDYMCNTIIEAPTDSARELQTWYQKFRLSSGALARYRSLLPLSTQVSLWMDRVRRRVVLGHRRWYVMLSTARLLPVLIPLLLVVDYGVDLPGAQSGRRMLDGLGISIFRRAGPAPQPGDGASEIARLVDDDMRKTVEKREISAGVWGTGVWGTESWLRSQLLYGYVCGVGVSAEDIAIHVLPKLRHLFSEYSPNDTHQSRPVGLMYRDGRAYAWRRSAHNDTEFILPGLWAGATAARGWRISEPGSEARAELEKMITVVDTVLLNFQNAEGGYSLYPLAGNEGNNCEGGGSEPDSENAYSDALVMAYLLERVHVNDGDRGRALERLEQISDRVALLYDRERGGWATHPKRERGGDDRIHRGLSFQLFGLLLRAERVLGGWRVPKEVREGELAFLVEVGATTVSVDALAALWSDTEENSGRYCKSDGSFAENEILVSYSWVPWAWEATCLLLGDDGRLSTGESIRLRRFYNSLAANPSGVATWAAERGHWQQAEVLMATLACRGDPIEPLAGGGVPRGAD